MADSILAVGGPCGSNGVDLGTSVMEENNASQPDPIPIPIAVVGLGMRLPGAVHTESQFWDILVNKQSTRCEIPATRFSTEGFYSSSGEAGSVAIRHGHFLAESDSLRYLDAEFFSMGLDEANKMEPQQRLLLEVVYECMESAGQQDWRGSNIGCWVGTFGEDWLDLHSKDIFDLGLNRILGGHDFALSNRVNYEYNLTGPSTTIETACSSSLIALHDAVRALRAGDCSGAIVAGTSLIFSPTMSIAMTEQGVLSPDGRCKSFDADADGFARGEAINALYLKRLDTALKDGDPIRAVVRGTASNADGKTVGMFAPSTESHISLMRSAYHECGLDPTATVFVEAHGTGTPVGDPLEANAIAQVFGGSQDRPVYLGSVKPNFGHGEGASGLTSVIKAILAMEHRTIPPNINFTTPNPKIPFKESNMIVPLEAIPWPERQPLRVSINSFGIGGANAHCIVETLGQYLNDCSSLSHVRSICSTISGLDTLPKELHRTNGVNDTKIANGTNMAKVCMRINGATTAVLSTGEPTAQLQRKQIAYIAEDRDVVKDCNSANNEGTHQPKKVLYVLSATSAATLTTRSLQYKDYHESARAEPTDISYTLCNRREHHAHRAYAVTSGSSDRGPANPLEFSLPARVNMSTGTPPQVIMVFTGQGAQWAGMAAELIDEYPVFCNTIRDLGRALSKLEHAPTWDLIEELGRSKETSRVGSAEFSQPLVCAVQVALVDLLRHWGISPAAVVGHSSGEIAAAYAAGAITSTEAITIAYYRGYVNKTLARQGRMAAIGLGRAQIAPYLSSGVVLACDNSPESVTLSGDKEALEEACRQVRLDESCLVRELQVQVAYHSHHMQDVAYTFESLLEGKVCSSAPVVPFISSVTTKQVQEARVLDAAYWRKNLVNPVQFTGAVKNILTTELGTSRYVFVEIGPHSALAGPLRQTFTAYGTGQEYYASTLTRGKDGIESMLALVGELFLQGVELSFSHICTAGNVLTDLPLYPWNHDKYFWDEGRISKDWRCRKYPNHELMGSKALESSSVLPEWRNVIKLEKVPWLRDHQVGNDVIFPCAGYLAIAVEACRQATEATSIESFSLSNVIVYSALVLTESSSTEILTSLQPVKLTETLNASWWAFTIMSYNGSAWRKHCDGQVRAGRDAHQLKAALSVPVALAEDEQYPRSVEGLYPELNRIGLHYGPSFRGLDKVYCQPKGMKAIASLTESTTAVGSRYAIHPTTLDHCLQAFLPACCDGIFSRMKKVYLPTGIDNMCIVDGRAKDIDGARIEASVETKSSFGSVSGDCVVATKAGATLVTVQGAKFSPLDTGDGGAEDADAIAAAQLVWGAHLDFANMHDLVRPSRNLPQDFQELDSMERLSVLAILIIWERLQVIPLAADREHLASFAGWIESQATSIINGSYSGLETEPEKLASMASHDRFALFRELCQKLMESGLSSGAVLVGRLVEQCEDILQGLVEGIDVLVADDGLTKSYNYMESRIDSVDFFACAGHTLPTLRILEIGAGTGGVSEKALNSLTTGGGQERMYSRYTFSDISGGFFGEARERLKAFSAVDFQVLDISKDPMEQGFEPGSFDLIIADNVIHCTPSINQALSNVRKLLAPGGYFLLQEVSTAMRMSPLIMGILPGWWLGAAEGRITGPCLSLEQWYKELNRTGFSLVNDAILDAPDPYHLKAVIISRAEPDVSSDKAPKPRAVLLHCAGDEQAGNAVQVRSAMDKAGISTRLISIDQYAQVGKSDASLVVSLLDIRAPFLGSMSTWDMAALQSVIGSLGRTPMLWIMPQAQRNIGAAADAGFGMSLGFLRTIRSEHPVAITSVEMDCYDERAMAAMVKLATRVVQEHEKNGAKLASAPGVDPDREFVLTKGVLETSRYHAVSLSQEMVARAPEAEAVTLDIGRPGLLQTLQWVNLAAQSPGPDEVIVQPRCVGLNFRDVLVCMGVLKHVGSNIGLEGSGTITQVGSNVSRFRPGDDVMWMDNNSFSTQVKLQASQCAQIPERLTWEQAATMPCVYATVIHSLMDKAGLQTGQSVLIHSACGGVGIAALHLCSHIGGVEIYTTVGSEEKAQFLMERFGLPRSRIFCSRDSSFLHDVRAATGGRGVDVVLNSLSGELLHASWQCVAEGGTMVEIGKRDFAGRARLQMDRFEDNRSFMGVNVSGLEPTAQARLLQRAADMAAVGAIQPIEPLSVFDAGEVEASFRYMQKGVHMGKIVVRMPESSKGLVGKANANANAAPTPSMLDSEATYVVVGGLGGLGRVVVRWLVEERGARHLVLMSRTAGQSAQDQAVLRELQWLGCTTQAVVGDVTRRAHVERAFAVAAASGRRVAGVLQLSMVLCDQAFLDMTWDEWRTAVAPKVQGTWNLHCAAPPGLDVFVAMGSVSGLWGMVGQANYAAGNSYLAALAQVRRARGLPATVVHLGPVDDAGYLARNLGRAQAFRAAGGYHIGTRQLLQALDWALAPPSRRPAHLALQLAVGLRAQQSLLDPASRVIWRNDARFARYRYNYLSTAAAANKTAASSPASTSDVDANALQVLLASLPGTPQLLASPPSLQLITRVLGAQIYTFMLRPVQDLDANASLAALGIDSLVTIELRHWIERTFVGVELTTLAILDAGTIAGLAKLISHSLEVRFAQTT